ncbi:MAG: hypothetical protein KBA31_01550 [Alphaproteobacteria bacterium]|nr:hypothetical protein [Alphaproteobacteria bacterium]
MRRWFWPYAILAIVLLLLGLFTLLTALTGIGPGRVDAQIAVADATVIEPSKRFLVSMLDMVAPFDVPRWAKNLYAVLVLVALGGMALSTVVGVLLLPVFYALYRNRE